MKGVALAMKTATRFTSPKFPFDPPKMKDLMGSVAASANTLHGLYPPTSAADPKCAADRKI
jgi:hypothetical protein